MKISQSHLGRKGVCYVRGGLHNENMFTGARNLVIFCKRSQATCLSSILILSETTCSGGRCPYSQGHKCGRQDVLLSCSVTGQMLTQGIHELGLTLGATAHRPHVPEASYLPTSSLDFLDSERMEHLICLTRCLWAENQVASAEHSAECWAQSTPEPWGSALWPPAYLRAA